MRLQLDETQMVGELAGHGAVAVRAEAQAIAELGFPTGYDGVLAGSADEGVGWAAHPMRGAATPFGPAGAQPVAGARNGEV